MSGGLDACVFQQAWGESGCPRWAHWAEMLTVHYVCLQIHRQLSLQLCTVWSRHANPSCNHDPLHSKWDQKALGAECLSRSSDFVAENARHGAVTHSSALCSWAILNYHYRSRTGSLCSLIASASFMTTKAFSGSWRFQAGSPGTGRCWASKMLYPPLTFLSVLGQTSQKESELSWRGRPLGCAHWESWASY